MILKKVGALTVAVAFAILLPIADSAKPAFAGPLRVGISTDVKTALIRLADAQGFFKKRGIDVTLKEYDSGAAAAEDLITDKVDLATAAEFVFVLQSFKHPTLRMAATVCAASDLELIVRADRAIVKPADLKGKRIAIPRGTAAEFFLHNYLIFNHIPAGNVQIVHKAPSEIVKAMADGTVDAALCWPPHTTRTANLLGAKAARWPAQSGQEYYFALFGKEGFLKNQRGSMEKFLAALIEAEEFAANHPDRAKALLRQRLGADAASAVDMWAYARFQLQLTQDLLVLMEREAKWAIRNNLAEKREVPNYLQFFYFDALDKVRPEAVTVVH